MKKKKKHAQGANEPPLKIKIRKNFPNYFLHMGLLGIWATYLNGLELIKLLNEALIVLYFYMSSAFSNIFLNKVHDI